MTNKALIRRLQISCLGLDPIDPLRLLVDDVIEALRERALYEVQRLGQEIEQEPVAWMKPDVLCDRACMYLCTKGFTQFPECANVPPQLEQNFCPRCGKRTNDIHTCTPPMEKNNG